MTQPYKLEFTLEGLPATTNSIGRKHWGAKVKEANTWKTRVAYMARKLGLPKHPLKTVYITLIRYSSNAPDPDGLVSTFKHVIDGLVEVGVIQNDRVDNIGMPLYAWEKAQRGKGSIRVIVEQRGGPSEPAQTCRYCRSHLVQEGP